MSRPRCDDRPAHGTIGSDGSFTKSEPGDATRVVVVDGIIQSGVTQGKIKQWLNEGKNVTEYVYDSEVTQEEARQLVNVSLASGNISDAKAAGTINLDMQIVTGAAAARVSAVRENPGLAALKDVQGVDDITLWRWTKLIESNPNLPIHCNGGLLQEFGHLSDQQMLAAINLVPELTTEQAKKAVDDPELVAMALRSKRAATARWELLQRGADLTGLTDQQIIAALHLVGQHGTVGALSMVKEADQRTLLRLMAGWSDADGDWQTYLETIWRTNPELASNIIDIALGGTLDPGSLEALVALGPKRALGISAAALTKTAAQLLRDGTVAPTDSALLAARVVTIFGKRSPEYLQQALKAGWTLHEASSFLPAGGPYDGLADYLLKAGITTWDSPQRSRTAALAVAQAWPEMREQLQHLSLRQAQQLIRLQENLDPKWAGTGLGDVVGELNEGRAQSSHAGTLWLVSQLQPSIYPSDTFQTGGGRKLTGQFLPRHSGEPLFFGQRTNCCQRLGGAGETCAIDSQTNPTSSLFVVRDKDGKIVAGSWVWLAKNGEIVCFDNIEYLKGDMSAEEKEELIAGLREVYQQASDHLAQAWGIDVHVGSRYTDSGLIAGLDEAKVHRPDGYTVSGEAYSYTMSGEVYSDAQNQYLLAAGAQTEAWRPTGGFGWRQGDTEIHITTHIENDTVHITIPDGLTQEQLTQLTQQLKDANPKATIRTDSGVIIQGEPLGNLLELAETLDINTAFLNQTLTQNYTDISPQRLTGYLAFGITDLEDIKKFSELGYTAEVIRELQRRGVVGMDNLQRLHDIGLPLTALWGYGNCTITEIEQLWVAGIDGRETTHYQLVDIVTVDAMIMYNEAGLGGSAVGLYREGGHNTLEKMKELLAAGITGEDARFFARSGFKTIEEIKAVQAAGVTALEVHTYKTVGIQGDEIFELHQQGVTAQGAVGFADSGYLDTDEMIRITALGLPGDVVLGYHSYGITDLDKMLKLSKAGLFITELRELEFAEIEDLEMVIKLGESGIDVYSIAQYGRVGLHTEQNILDAKRKGIDPQTAGDYIRLGIDNPTDMQQLLHAGILARQAAELLKDGETTTKTLIQQHGKRSPIDVAVRQQLVSKGVRERFITEVADHITDPEVIEHAHREKLLPPAVTFLTGLGYSIQDIVQFRDAQISYYEVEEFNRAELKKVEDIIEAKQQGIVGAQAASAYESGARTLEEMKKYGWIYI